MQLTEVVYQFCMERYKKQLQQNKHKHTLTSQQLSQQELQQESQQELQLQQQQSVAAEQYQQALIKQSCTSGSDVYGYWPLRWDFEVEYDNDAEKVSSNTIYMPLHIAFSYNTQCNLGYRNSFSEVLISIALYDGIPYIVFYNATLRCPVIALSVRCSRYMQ